jgi:hypothetical protein
VHDGRAREDGFDNSVRSRTSFKADEAEFRLLFIKAIRRAQLRTSRMTAREAILQGLQTGFDMACDTTLNSGAP